jgi:hypothetical protein
MPFECGPLILQNIILCITEINAKIEFERIHNQVFTGQNIHHNKIEWFLFCSGTFFFFFFFF